MSSLCHTCQIRPANSLMLYKCAVCRFRESQELAAKEAGYDTTKKPIKSCWQRKTKKIVKCFGRNHPPNCTCRFSVVAKENHEAMVEEKSRVVSPELSRHVVSAPVEADSYTNTSTIAADYETSLQSQGRDLMNPEYFEKLRLFQPFRRHINLGKGPAFKFISKVEARITEEIWHFALSLYESYYFSKSVSDLREMQSSFDPRRVHDNLSWYNTFLVWVYFALCKADDKLVCDYHNILRVPNQAKANYLRASDIAKLMVANNENVLREINAIEVLASVSVSVL